MEVAAMNSLSLLQKALSGQPDAIPKGFKTAQQWADKWNIPLSSTEKKLRQASRRGLVEVKKIRIDNGLRGLYPVPHYKLNLK